MKRNIFVTRPDPGGGGRVRVSEAEHAALLALADFERLNLSEMLRLLIREGAAKRGLWPPVATAAAKEAADGTTR